MTDQQFNNLCVRYGKNFLTEYADYDAPKAMGEMDDMEEFSILEAMQMCYSGENYFNREEAFNPYAAYYINDAGKLYSINESDLRKFLIEKCGEWEDEFIGWCEDNGYIR